jgi:hypothetical protein
MVVTARVNGVVQVDSIKVTGPQVKITLQKTSMLPSVSPGTDVNYPRDEVQTITVSVVDTANQPIPNRIVQLKLKATEGSAGHSHISSSYPKPGGKISAVVNTGPTGVLPVVYTAPDPSGPVWIQGLSSGAGSAQKKISIEVPGLQRYDSGIGADMTGALPEHPDNHYATSGHLSRLGSLIFYFTRQWPTKRLTLNDSSLPLGGLYDINTRWTPAHVGHRWGNNTDLKTHDYSTTPPTPVLTDAQKNFVKLVWMDLAGGKKKLIDHPVGGSVRAHLHLIY